MKSRYYAYIIACLPLLIENVFAGYDMTFINQNSKEIKVEIRDKDDKKLWGTTVAAGETKKIQDYPNLEGVKGVQAGKVWGTTPAFIGGSSTCKATKSEWSKDSTDTLVIFNDDYEFTFEKNPIGTTCKMTSKGPSVSSDIFGK